MKVTHRNITAKLFCPTCDHAYFPHDEENATGMCLRAPPTMYVVGMMQPTSPVIKAKPEATDPSQMRPLLRAYYPPIGPLDTCSQYHKKVDGVA